MKTRTLILMAAAIAVAAAGWTGWRLAQGSSPLTGPVILISIDTLRADRLPIYGYRKVATPAIDALAGGGVVFDHAWAHSPQTLPSHASMLTGQLPFAHGVRDNMGFALSKGAATLPGLLAARGYATGGFVSAYVLRKETGIAQGFAMYDDTLPPGSPEKATGEVQRDGAETWAAAERWMKTLSSDRFFLFLHLYEPHSPYTPPDAYRRYEPYDGEIAYADALVGRVVASLEARGVYDDALIILLSDHGEGLGDHGEMEHGIFVYSETIRVPLVVKLPGQRQAGLRVSAPVQHVDLLPTILDLAGTTAPGGVQGQSLRPLFDGGAFPERGLYAESLYGRYHLGWSDLYALTDARFRFIRAPRDELYDLQTDPGERANVAGARESTRVAMRQALERLMAGARVDAPSQVSDEDREQLKALGYVSMQAAVNPQAGSDSLPDPKDRVHVLEEYRRALDMVRDSRMDEAIEALRALVRENPAMGDVWGEIAGLLVKQGRMDDALEAYKRLVEAAPYDPAAIVSVAQVLVEMGRLDEARQQAEAALKILPASEGRWRATAHKMLMRVALAKKDLETARAEAARAADEEPGFPMPDYLEGLIRYEAGEFDDAVPFFARALDASRARTFQVPDLRHYLGDSLARIERFGEAEPLLIEEVRLFPSSLRARSGLAMLYRVQDRVEESNAAIDAMLRVSPTPEGFATAEKLYTMFGDTARAAAVKAAAQKASRGRKR